MTLQWEIDGNPVISVDGAQRNVGSVVVEENSTPKGNFDALLAALRRGNTGRIWLAVDGRPRFSYVVSLIGFSAAWDEVMGDWRE